MKIKKGLSRIYIVIASLWSLFVFYSWKYEMVSGNTALILILLTIPIYFVLRWVARGFE